MTDRPLESVIADNLTAVRARLARAAARSGRAPDSIRLIAVSKTFSLDAIRAAIAAGQRDFGENKVQEALPKIEALAAEFPDAPESGGAAPGSGTPGSGTPGSGTPAGAAAANAAGTGAPAASAARADSGSAPGGASGGPATVALRWHLIGHLQSNKARKAARPFDAIHSIDSLDLLHKVDAAAQEARRRPELLVQVDLAGESTKFGAPLDIVRDLFTAGRDLAAARLVGLMTLPPFFDDPEAARPYFRRLRELRDALGSEGVPESMLRELSMGMSHDFDVAIAEGATMVRVGTAIFGTRPKP